MIAYALKTFKLVNNIILTEIFLSFQIIITSGSNKYLQLILYSNDPLYLGSVDK
jgi:hypothetical protein